MVADNPKTPDNAQRQRFINAARAAECGEDEAAFDEALKRIARVKPVKPPEKNEG